MKFPARTPQPQKIKVVSGNSQIAALSRTGGVIGLVEATIGVAAPSDNRLALLAFLSTEG